MAELTDAQRPYFEPKGADGRAKWEQVYSLLAALEPNDLLAYSTVIEVTGLDLQEDRSPLYAAQRHLEQNKRRTVEAVDGIGYRIVLADEHARLALGHAKRAKRQYTKAKRRTTYVREEELTTDAARAELADLRARVGSLEQHARWSAKKLGAVDEAVKGLKTRTKRVESASEKLAKNLAAQEAKMAKMQAEMRDLRKQQS